MKTTHTAIVGATGAVGQELMQVLEKRNFPAGELSLFASARSAGKTMMFRGKPLPVRELNENSFQGVDIALFSAGGSTSRKFAPIAASQGCVVVDNSSAFRMDPGTPLVVPEINPRDVKNHKGIIANPNCSTIILLMAIYPIHRVNRVRRAVVSTYQAASGAGAVAMDELRTQAGDFLSGREVHPAVFPHPIAFNVFSHNSDMDLDSGYNQEELKMVNESRKILHDDAIQISPTCVRVGTFRAHAESIHLTLTNPISVEEIRTLLDRAPGVRVVDERHRNHFPMPLEASGQDDVLVGRIRRDIAVSDGREIELFCCGDQLLKGAALNAVQIAELL